MAALTNLQQTAASTGVGRVDVTLESPAARRGPRARRRRARRDALRRAARRSRRARGALDLAQRRAGAARWPACTPTQSMHLPKRFSHWAVDTLRAVPWIGPAPIAWLEDQALAVRDAYRRVTFHARGDATDVVATRRAAAAGARHVGGVGRGGALAARAHPDASGRSPRRARASGSRPTSRGCARCPGVARRRALALLPDLRPPRRGAPLREGPPRRDGHCASSTSTWRPASRTPSRSPGRTAPGASRATRPSTGASPPPSTARSRPSTATTG